MPNLQAIDTTKVHHDLIALATARNLATTAEVPVVIQCRPEALARIEALVVEAGGRLRHRLTLSHAISAWVSIQCIVSLSQDPDVVEMELAGRYQQIAT